MKADALKFFSDIFDMSKIDFDSRIFIPKIAEDRLDVISFGPEIDQSRCIFEMSKIADEEL